MPFALQAAGLTDVGCVRERNEDAFLADAEGGIFIVADGMGGRRGGDVAARLAVESIQEFIRGRFEAGSVPPLADISGVLGMLEDAVMAASGAIRNEGGRNMEHFGMGAAVVAALVVGSHVHVAHMGDSRAYLSRRGGFEQLSQDHSIVGALLRHGEISPAEAENHPARGRLSRFVGMESFMGPAMRAVELSSGDRLMLCTDGLWGMVGDMEMAGILSRSNDCEVTCRALIEAGRAAGGEDNLTAVVVDVW
jgi:protein phosphatase